MALSVTLGGVTLLLNKMDEFVEVMRPNLTTTETLSGHLFTDFRGNNRAWEIHFHHLCREDYEDLRQVYFDQFTNAIYPIMVLNDGVDAVTTYVKMSIDDKNVKYDGDMVMDFGITLEEQGPIS